MNGATAQVVVAVAFVVAAVAISVWQRIGLAGALIRAAARAAIQLGVVGLIIAAVFAAPVFAVGFVAAMLAAASLTSAGRLAAVPRARLLTTMAIGIPALTATAALLVAGAFAVTPRAVVPAAGILIGGAMTATTLTGRRLVEALHDEAAVIETRLCLGDDARTALAPLVHRAVVSGLIPAIDQTRTVGLVTLPGTFVGLVLGGASPAQAARIQLLVLCALLAVELGSAVMSAELVLRQAVAAGERVIDFAVQPPHGRRDAHLGRRAISGWWRPSR